MKKCIYCLKAEDATSFTNKEHVLPRAFGTFNNNLTLKNEVCNSCNQKFGNELEVFLGRDSYEGISRYKFKPQKNYKFKNTRLIIRLAEGRFKGMFVDLVYSEEAKKPTISPKKQIGFR